LLKLHVGKRPGGKGRTGESLRLLALVRDASACFGSLRSCGGEHTCIKGLAGKGFAARNCGAVKEGGWYARQDSNLRPFAPEADHGIFTLPCKSRMLLILQHGTHIRVCLSMAQFGPVWRKWHTSGTQKSGYNCS